MIIDIGKFIQQEKNYWIELEEYLTRLEADPLARLGIDELKRFHYLYERVGAALVKLRTFATEQETRTYLESLVTRAYGEIHESRTRPRRFRPLRWFTRTFPQTFRRHVRLFWLAAVIMVVGGLVGGSAILIDPQAKPVLLPFPHLLGDPSDRVAAEEQDTDDRLASAHARFSTMLMTHNTKVAITAMAMGMTWGIGTVIAMFYNGVILGAVAVDYILAGETVFLFGWLLPHGVIEIPSIIIAGQAGFLLAGALLDRRSRLGVRARLRRVAPDLVTLCGGFAVMLIWAGFVESYFSQHHQPVIPYALKIALGIVELSLLTGFLTFAGRAAARPAAGGEGGGGGEGAGG